MKNLFFGITVSTRDSEDAIGECMDVAEEVKQFLNGLMNKGVVFEAFRAKIVNKTSHQEVHIHFSIEKANKAPTWKNLKDELNRITGRELTYEWQEKQ